MANAGSLINDVAFLQPPLPLAFVFEFRPAFENHDELKIAVMDMPMLDFVGFRGAGRTDDVGDIVTIGRVFDADIAILEYLAEAWRPFGFSRRAVGKFPIFRQIALLYPPRAVPVLTTELARKCPRGSYNYLGAFSAIQERRMSTQLWCRMSVMILSPASVS